MAEARGERLEGEGKEVLGGDRDATEDLRSKKGLRVCRDFAKNHGALGTLEF